MVIPLSSSNISSKRDSGIFSRAATTWSDNSSRRVRLSARGHHRVLKVARTIADLGGAETVARRHIAEALSYRRIGPYG